MRFEPARSFFIKICRIRKPLGRVVYINSVLKLICKNQTEKKGTKLSNQNGAKWSRKIFMLLNLLK